MPYKPANVDVWSGQSPTATGRYLVRWRYSKEERVGQTDGKVWIVDGIEYNWHVAEEMFEFSHPIPSPSELAATAREIAELREWKATEQQFLIRATTMLIEAGYRGEGPGLMEAIVWIVKERDELRSTTITAESVEVVRSALSKSFDGVDKLFEMGRRFEQLDGGGVDRLAWEAPAFRKELKEAIDTARKLLPSPSTHETETGGAR